MSFFDWQQRTLVPRNQIAGLAGAVQGNTAGEAAEAAAAETEEDILMPAPVVFEESTFEEPSIVRNPLGPQAEEKKGGKPDVLATAEGKFGARPSLSEGVALDREADALRAMAKRETIAKLRTMVTEEEAMLDAEDLYAADHDAADELINRGMSRYHNRVEKFDEDLERYRTQEIDPNQLFGNMTGAGRFAAALNVAVGQMVSTATGNPNAALSLVQGAIDRDILAQKANRNAALVAAQQGFAMAKEDRAALGEELGFMAEQRALRFAYLRQQIARSMAQARTQAQRDRLTAFDTLVAGEVAKNRIANRDAQMSIHVKAALRAGGDALRKLRLELPRLEAEAQQFLGQGSEMDVPPATVFDGQEAPEMAPESPVEAEATPLAATPTEAALSERRQRNPRARVRTETPVEDTPVEDAPAAEDSATLTPTEAGIPEEPSVLLTPEERARQGLSTRLAPIGQKADPRELGYTGAIEEARKLRDRWVEENRPYNFKDDPEAWNALSRTEKEAYNEKVFQWKWLKENPEYFQRPGFTPAELTGGEKQANFVVMRDLTNRVTGTDTYMLEENSPLRFVPKTKRETKDVDQVRALREDILESGKTAKKASAVASAVEEFGLPSQLEAGKVLGVEIASDFRIHEEDGKLVFTGISGEGSAKAITEVRRLRTKLLSLAAAFVKEFDPTSRLSDQDMRIAMQALGITSFDALLTAVVRETIETGGDQLLKGYADFLRAYGEDVLHNSESKARSLGVIFPPSQDRRNRQKAKAFIEELQRRKVSVPPPPTRDPEPARVE